MTVTARYQRPIDAALAYREAWRARKAFAEQFREEPHIEQVFLRATAAQFDKNVNDTRENLERMAIRPQNDRPNKQDLARTKKTERKQKMTNKSMKVVGVATPLMIAMLLLFAGSPSVNASNNDRPSAVNAAVKIDNFVFGPQTLTVPVGTTVTWTNSDDIPHTSVSTEGVFKSKVLDTDENFSYTFTKAGTYPYYCTIHPKMTGKVVVQ